MGTSLQPHRDRIFQTSTGTRNKATKHWGVIFTCLTSQAIHLDIVDSLSMDACINALEWFLAQYADVTVAFYSDNGTNFQGTSNAMTRMYNKNMHQELQRYFCPRRISWHFNTPSASSQWGLGMTHLFSTPVTFQFTNRPAECCY